MVNKNINKQSLIFASLNSAEIFGMDKSDFYHSAYNYLQ
jgi:hypothetical protein